MCGENRINFRAHFHVEGSSPRVRGKRSRVVKCFGCGGLIPACAGKTRARVSLRRRFRAHPRVCGENLITSSVSGIATGSSPRVRGKPVIMRLENADDRLIPACAGKTDRYPLLGQLARAHPRVCGENFPYPNGGQSDRGSSPRVRGKPNCIAREALCMGLIPACAGKTLCN